MAMVETWYNQDLNQPVQLHYLDGNVFSQDRLGNLIGVHVFDNNLPASLSGTVSGNVIRADGGTVTVAGTLTGNDCYIILPGVAYAVPGPISIIIKLSGGGSDTTLCAVVANVYQASTDTAIDPGTIIPSVQDLIDAIESAVALIPPDYTDLKNTSGEVDSTANLLRLDGKYWFVNNGVLDSSTYALVSCFQKIRCSKGNVFRLQTKGLGTAPSYIITDIELNVLASGSTGVFDGELTITQNDAYYLCVNCDIDAVPYFTLYQTNINSNDNVKAEIDDIQTKQNDYFVPSDNIIDLSKMAHNVGYYNDDGAYQDSSNYRYYTISVEPSTTYRISAFRHYLTFWNFMFQCYTTSSIGTGGAISSDVTITTPVGCRYIRVTFQETADDNYINTFVLCKGTQAHDERLSPYPTLNPNIIIENIEDIIRLNNTFSPVIDMTIGGVISDTTGKIEYSSSVNLAASDVYYQMFPGAKYIFWADDSTRYNIYFYDADKNFVEAITTNDNTKTEQSIYVNEYNYAFFRVGAYKYGGISGNLKSVHATMTFTPKKIVCLGDSFTAGNGAAVAYHMYLARKTGWTCLNYGVGGAGWAYNMTGSTTVGNGIEGLAPGGVTPSYDTDFMDAVEILPTDGDLYVLFGGYNDWNTDQTEQTFENAVEATISYIQDNIPNGRILVISPAQRYLPNGKDGRNANAAGLTILDYCGIIERVAKVHGVRFVNLYTESELYPYSQANRETYFDADGLHPNANGQKLIYQRIVSICADLCN